MSKHNRKNQGNENKPDLLYRRSLYIWVTIGFISLTSVVFFWGRHIQIEGVADNTLLGTYGDFIGGILGTIFAMFSMLLMIKTFLEQRRDTKDELRFQRKDTIDREEAENFRYIATVKNQRQLNEDIRVNDLFFELLRLYHSEISKLTIHFKNNETIHGKECIDVWVDMIRRGNYDPNMSESDN